MDIHFEVIGHLSSPFHEKFGVPRQSLLVDEARAVLKLKPDSSFPLALRHLDQFSHVWIVFVFDRSLGTPWHPLIEIPRVEAGRRMGVFATRSPHRPNPIGMSAVKLDRIDYGAVGGIEIHLRGVDILDGTPVLDIKPYLPYADRIEEANSGWIKSDIRRFPVEFAPVCSEKFARNPDQRHLQALITQMLELDPRPTSQRRSAPIDDPGTEGRTFAFRILDLDVHWEVRQGQIYVKRIDDLELD